MASSALSSFCVFLWTATNGQSFFWRTAPLRSVGRACFVLCLSWTATNGQSFFWRTAPLRSVGRACLVMCLFLDCYKRAVLFLAHRSTAWRHARLPRYLFIFGLLQTGSPFFGAPLHFVASSALSSLCVFLGLLQTGSPFFFKIIFPKICKNTGNIKKLQ